MKAGHSASGEIYKGGGSTQAEKTSYEKIYKINDGAEVKVSSQFIQRLSNEILDFENFTDDLTKMFEEHIEKCINKTKHVIFTTAKSHYTVNGHNVRMYAHQRSKSTDHLPQSCGCRQAM